jgi:imidazolonepropionase-like amidohydrolase
VLEDPEPAQLTREEARTVVEEAHRLGKRVAAHAEGQGGTRIAIEEGVDTIEHGLSLHRTPELLELMAEQDQTLVPTLSTFHDVSEDHAEKYPCSLVEQAKRQREEAYKTLIAATQAGVRIAMGFDSYPLGENARELVRMVDGGLTPMQGIVAATSGAAAALGLEGVGRIQAGAIADLLVIDGDPLKDPSVLLDPRRIDVVLQAGSLVDAA